MNEINSTNNLRVVAPFAVDERQAQRQAETIARDIAGAGDIAGDVIEVSPAGAALATLHDTDSTQLRMELVARIRSELQNGLYDLNGKLDVVVDRLIDDLI